MTLPCALTIAGSDSSGGAGIQADLRTFAALEVYGASALTAVTSQNTLGVRGVAVLEPAFVADQIDAVLDDIPVRAVKTGMLGSAAVAAAVVAALARWRVSQLVVDPVLVSTSGASLLGPEGLDVVRARLVKLAAFVTPNLDEAAALCGFAVRSVDDQERAARFLVDELGAKAALVKGGHASGDPVDVLFVAGRVPGGAAGGVIQLRATRVESRHTHGTGCTLSAAVCAYMARGDDVEAAVGKAHAFVQRALLTSPGIGRGRGPLHHMHPWYGS